MADDSFAATAPTLELRPYRSHKTPACDLCRTRKIRCHIDIAGQSCKFCRARGIDCIYSSGTVVSSSTGSSCARPAKRRRRSSPAIRPMGIDNDSPNDIENFPNVVGTSPTESSLLMNPTMAEDIEVLEKYLTSNPSVTASTSRPYNVISNTPGKPIIYLTIPRRRKGFHMPTEPGKVQREILDQILHPLQSEVIMLCGRSPNDFMHTALILKVVISKICILVSLSSTRILS